MKRNENTVAKKKRPPDNVERADPETEALVAAHSRALAAMSVSDRVAYGRSVSLRTLRRWRRMMREDAKGTYGDRGSDPEFYRERIRESQIGLLRLRAWRATGVEPGNG
jgi:hypothetical protein